MVRPELSPTELLQRLNRLVTALGTAVSATDLPKVVLRQLVATFGASAARLTLIDESLGPARRSWPSTETPRCRPPPGSRSSSRWEFGASGVIELGFEEPQSISEVERSSMHAAAALVAQAVENVHLVDAVNVPTRRVRDSCSSAR